jgi:hypothetical protein
MSSFSFWQWACIGDDDELQSEGEQDRLQPGINAEGATWTSTDHKEACPQIEIKAIKLPSSIMENNE